MRRLVGFILPLLVLSTAGADDLYVSPKGSDTASGSKQHPFATLGRARDAVRKVSKDQDVTIWIEGGLSLIHI